MRSFFHSRRIESNNRRVAKINRGREGANGRGENGKGNSAEIIVHQRNAHGSPVGIRRSSALCCIAIKISAVNYSPPLRRYTRLSAPAVLVSASATKTAKIKRRTERNAPRLMTRARRQQTLALVFFFFFFFYFLFHATDLIRI